MNRYWYGLLLVISSCGSERQEPEHVLWYEQPATSWMTEALPIGNGRLAAMVYSGVAEEHIQFNEESLWEGGVGEWKEYIGGNRAGASKYLPRVRELLVQGETSAAHDLANATLTGQIDSDPEHEAIDQYYGSFGAYQPFGDIHISIPSTESVDEYRRELDIQSAIHRVHYRSGKIRHKREYFASYPAGALVFRLQNDSDVGVDYSIRLSTEHPSNVEFKNDTLILSGHLQRNQMKFEARLLVKFDGLGASWERGELTVNSAKSITLILVAGTEYLSNYPTYKGKDYVGQNARRINEVRDKRFGDLMAEHMSDYKALFDRVSLNLGDSSDIRRIPTDRRLRRYQEEAVRDNGLEALFFQYGRYLLISASRDGSMPANLQGKWNDQKVPAWASDYHFNINIQMIYWPAEVTGLPEVHRPLLGYVQTLVEPGRLTAREMFGAKGWVVNTMNNPFGFTATGWDFPWGYFPGGAAWLSQHLWEHYAFSGDEQFLREDAWPVMREAAEFWLSYLTPLSDGNLVSQPSYSPEHGGISRGASMDHQIAWDLFTNILDACDVLKRDLEFCRAVTDARARLSRPKIGRWGQLQEWLEDVDDPNSRHRHVSHLFALFPGRQIDPIDTPELVDAAKVSLMARGDNGTGWSVAWKILLWARLGDGDKSHALLKRLMRYSDQTGVEYSEGGGGTYSNLFVAHPPLQMDGNGGGTAGIAEMLLQSHSEIVRLLPALPTDWHEGSISGLRARGGLIVNVDWTAGRVGTCHITATRPGTFHVEYNGRKHEFIALAGDVFSC